MLLFLFVGSFLLRFAARTLFSLLFHEPPRSTLPGVPTVTGASCAPGHALIILPARF